MATVLETLIAVAPEFASTDTPRLDVIIDIADGETGQNIYKNRNLAVAYLAAHMLTLSNRNGMSGNVTMAKEGDLSMSFAPNLDPSALNSTSYGTELLRLRKGSIFGPRTRAG